MLGKLSKDILATYSKIFHYGPQTESVIQRNIQIKEDIQTLKEFAQQINGSEEKVTEIQNELDRMSKFVDTWFNDDYNYGRWDMFIKGVSFTVDKMLITIEMGKIK